MRSKGGNKASTALDNSLCDSTGCWEVDTSDATTRATIQKFKDAGRGVVSSAQAAGKLRAVTAMLRRFARLILTWARLQLRRERQQRATR